MKNDFNIYLRNMIDTNNRVLIYMHRNCKNNIPPIGFFILKYLKDNENEEIYQVDIERHFNMKKSTVSKLLSSMEEEKFISRKSIEKDARYKKIIIGEKAKELKCEIFKEKDEITMKLFENVTIDELEVFNNVLNKINRNLDS